MLFCRIIRCCNVRRGKIQVMNEATNNLPNDLDELKSLVHQLQQQNDQKNQFINQLLEQIKLARHQHFGTRSERFSLDQMALVFNEAEATVAAERDRDDTTEDKTAQTIDTQQVSSYRRAKGGRRPLPADLPRVEVVHELDDEDCTCDACQSPLDVIGEKSSEQLDLIPGVCQKFCV